MTSFTPGPWIVGKKYTMDVYAGHPQKRVAACFDDAADNAAHIVRCVNSHAELLAALQEMMEYAGIIEERCDSIATNKARAAIAKATS